MYELFQIQVDIALNYQFELMLPYYYNYDDHNAVIADNATYRAPDFRTTIIFYSSNLGNRRKLMQEAMNKIGALRTLIHQESSD